jgi:hypothetical protein
MSRPRFDRYHIDIYVPSWANESILEFSKIVSEKKLICSYHATKKYDRMNREYKKVVRDLIKTVDLELSIDYIFEFYAKDKEIKKVCYRFPMPELESDVIFVVAQSGKIVTIFLNRNFDPHISLDSSLYIQRGEIENVI